VLLPRQGCGPSSICIFEAIVLEAPPHLVDIFISREVPLCVRNRGLAVAEDRGCTGRVVLIRGMWLFCDYDFDACVVIVRLARAE